MKKVKPLAAGLLLVSLSCPSDQVADSFAWLDELKGERALGWVREQSSRTLEYLRQDERHRTYLEKALAVRLDERRIAGVSGAGDIHGGWIYVTRQDEQHPRGLWQRARLESYLTGEPKWEVLLDVDALGQREGKQWAFGQAEFLGRRCMIGLTLGNSIVRAWREFNVEARQFTLDGFVLSEKFAQQARWKNEDALYVWGDELRIREWSRRVPLAAAKEVFRGATTERVGMSTVGMIIYTDERGRRFPFVGSADAKLRTIHYQLGSDGRTRPLTVPPRSYGVYAGEFIFNLDADWTAAARTWKAGSILSVPLSEVTRQPAPASVRLVMEPGPQETIWGRAITHSGLLVTSYENARGRLWRFTFDGQRWQRQQLTLPDHGTIGLAITDPASDVALVTYESFVQPTTLYAADVGLNRIRQVKQAGAQFASERIVVEQFDAASQDGIRVPYFVVRPKDFERNGNAPTILEGYGISGVVMSPHYDGLRGRLWHEQGGVYVLANVRGGGEFGPAWHVTKAGRQHTYDDFIAVAEDLVRRRITSPRHLGIYGHSNGGLLAAVALNMRPHLFNAAVISHAILDQIKSSQSGWVGTPEYGYLDVAEDRAFLEKTSPYQNLQRRDQIPAPFILTATDDDDVEPQQARRYAVRLASFGMPYFYYESPEGGHFYGPTLQQVAEHEALIYTYLAQRLM